MYIPAPDTSEIEDLKLMDMQIRWLILSAKDQPDQIIKQISYYFPYHKLTYEQMNHNMKLREVELEMLKDEE